MIIVEQDTSVQHRFMACEWDEQQRDRGGADDEYVVTAADFVVDEFELYGLGD